MKNGLTLNNLHFSRGNFSLRLSLDIPQGEFGCLLGPSGCGKTTLLNLVGGFLLPEEGSINLMGRDITFTEPHKRKLGIVFQDYALFPHLTVAQNIAYGLNNGAISGMGKMGKLFSSAMGKEELRERVEELLKLVKLEGYGPRAITSLSGGEQQRIALARALAPKPDLLLLDEPLSALDVQLRGDLRREIRRIQEELGVTTLYITHDQEEALTLSDKIFLMKEGSLVQGGRPEEVYGNPSTLFAGQFLGRSNSLTGRAHKEADDTVITTAAGTIRNPQTGDRDSVQEGEGTLFFRPEDCLPEKPENKEEGQNNEGVFTGEVMDMEYYGSSYLAEIRMGEERIGLFFPVSQKPERGKQISFTLSFEKAHWFPKT